ncbi:MAG: glycerate kinase [Saprospiraceae bacterium]
MVFILPWTAGLKTAALRPVEPKDELFDFQIRVDPSWIDPFLFFCRMKIIVAADSFKDALSALEVCQAIRRGILQAQPGAEVILFPLADGGEGVAEVVAYHLKCTQISLQVADPLGRPVRATYCYSAGGRVAFVEMAQASGLQLLGLEERDPMKTTTYGTGQLIKDAIFRGAEKILLGIGGSATNDAGMGMATALGWRFLGANGQSIIPKGENLGKVVAIEGGLLDGLTRLNDPPVIEVLCDVANPLFGPTGAARTYARQKGADEESIDKLEAGMRHFSEVLDRHFGKNFAKVPGAGAAGGMGAGALAFLQARLRPGIEAMLELTSFDQQLAGVDLVITGEGKLDAQTMSGKLIQGICKRAGRQGVPVIAMCGTLEATMPQIEAIGLTAAFSIIQKPQTLKEAILETRQGLQSLAYNVLKTIGLGKT